MKWLFLFSALMVMNNEVIKKGCVSRETAKAFALLLSPMAPHAAEEIWANLGCENTLAYEAWPKYDESLAKDDLITMAVQVNGKTRSTIDVPADISKEDFLAQAKADEKVAKFIKGTIVKEIYVPGRICNIVVKG